MVLSGKVSQWLKVWLKRHSNLVSISVLFWHNWSRFLSCHLLIEFSRRINASPLERDTGRGGHYRAFLDQVEFRASFPLQVWSSVPPSTSRGNVVPTGHSSTPAPPTSCLYKASLHSQKGHKAHLLRRLSTLEIFDLDELMTTSVTSAWLSFLIKTDYILFGCCFKIRPVFHTFGFYGNKLNNIFFMFTDLYSNKHCHRSYL